MRAPWDSDPSWGRNERAWLARLDPQRMPAHVALVMDGNGRWAKARRQPRAAGHRAGAESAREITECTVRLGIPFLTLFAFSSENWKRPAAEVKLLMEMLHRNLVKRRRMLDDNGVRLHVLGDTAALPEPLRLKLEETCAASRQHSRLQLNLALNYGARGEIVRAARRLVSDGVPPEEVTEETLAVRLDTAGCPDPDLIVRTSGETRLSNFLLFQAAYSELYFTPTLWPDFRAAEFLRALVEYQNRHRRFGAL